MSLFCKKLTIQISVRKCSGAINHDTCFKLMNKMKTAEMDEIFKNRSIFEYGAIRNIKTPCNLYIIDGRRILR